MSTFNHQQRQLIDTLAGATAMLHLLAERTTHLSDEGHRAVVNWNNAKAALLAAPHGRRCWLCYCNLYQYNAKSVALDFFL